MNVDCTLIIEMRDRMVICSRCGRIIWPGNLCRTNDYKTFICWYCARIYGTKVNFITTKQTYSQPTSQ